MARIVQAKLYLAVSVVLRNAGLAQSASLKNNYMKRKMKVIIYAVTVFILILIVGYFYFANNIYCQLNRLSNGTPNQRARAADFFDKKEGL